MGLEGFRLGSLLIVLLIVVLLFGTKRIRHIGEDLGNAVRNFRKALHQEDSQEDTQQNKQNDSTPH
jgi:sec-independent protein translocase protein TatA